MTILSETPRTYPADWPAAGPIDLAQHDAPHRSSTVEWWYANAHLTALDGRQLSLFASFFRAMVKSDERTGEPIFAHALTWALADPQTRTYVAESLLDPDTPAIVKERTARGEGIRDPLIRRAIVEVAEKGEVPLPD